MPVNRIYIPEEAVGVVTASCIFEVDASNPISFALMHMLVETSFDNCNTPLNSCSVL
jgi:hypothetical protein